MYIYILDCHMHIMYTKIYTAVNNTPLYNMNKYTYTPFIIEYRCTKQ